MKIISVTVNVKGSIRNCISKKFIFWQYLLLYFIRNTQFRKIAILDVQAWSHYHHAKMVKITLKITKKVWKVSEKCVKSVQIQSFSGPYFPVFGLNTERYCVSLRVQSECGKIRTIKTPNKDAFNAVRKKIDGTGSKFVPKIPKTSF